MRKLAALLLAAALGGASAAQETNKFTVDGTNPDGGKYTGTVSLTELQPAGKIEGEVFAIEWVVGADTIKGVGMMSKDDRKTAVFAYPSGGGRAGIALMKQDGQGAKGVWFINGLGVGTEVWTPVAASGDVAATPPPAPAAGEPTYQRAVECAAATSFVLGMLRSTPGADMSKADAYDKANSAWIMKMSDFPEGKKTTENIKAIKAKQNEYAADPDGMAKATPVADECVATAPPM